MTVQTTKVQTMKRKQLAMALAMVLAEVPASGVIQFSADVAIEAAETGEGSTGQSAVAIVAYNGGPLVVAGYNAPIYLDLDGLTGLGRQLPLLRDHDKGRIIGTIEAKRVGNTIEASGRLVGRSTDREYVEELARDGYQWQASVGARPTEVRQIKAGQTATVNGREITGPAYIAVKSRLAETSIVTIGADDETAVQLAVAATDPDDDAAPVLPAGDTPGTLAAIRAERERRAAIEATAVRLINGGGDIEAIEAAMGVALTDRTQPEQFELQMLRTAVRPQGRITSGGGNELRGDELAAAVEASIMLHLGEGTEALERQFGERTLTAMDRHRHLRHGLSFQDAMLFAAEQNRQDVSRRDVSAMLRAAFPDVQASGQSTFSLSGIFSNIANKRMKMAFDSVESVWRAIAEIESVSDFKTITSYSLTGDMTYEKVAPGGELKHATIGEQTFTNAADTYGKLFALDRRDIINDDLGALSRIPRRLGRGGALSLNDVFWAAFLDSAAFFTSGNKNLIASGSSAPWYLLADPMDLAMIQIVFLNGRQQPIVEQTDADFKQLGVQMRGYHDFGVALQEPRAAVKSPAALDLAGLEAANLLFLNQTDYDDKPLAIRPRFLLTGNGNAVTARTLIESTNVLGPTSAKTPSINPFRGMFEPLSSSYLPNA